MNVLLDFIELYQPRYLMDFSMQSKDNLWLNIQMLEKLISLPKEKEEMVINFI